MRSCIAAVCPGDMVLARRAGSGRGHWYEVVRVRFVESQGENYLNWLLQPGIQMNPLTTFTMWEILAIRKMSL